MKRHAPEELDEELPLFASVEAARAKGHDGARRAARRATRIDPSWKSEALEAVREHSLRTREFLSEHVRVPMPDGCDRRALGHVMKEAQRLGYVAADGVAPAVSSNSSMKTKWRSLIFREAKSA